MQGWSKQLYYNYKIRKHFFNIKNAAKHGVLRHFNANKSILLVHLEARVAILEEGVYLLGGGNAGIDVCLGSLSTHFLRR